MSIITCVANTLDYTVIPGISVRIICVDHPTTFFEGCTNERGETTSLFDVEEGCGIFVCPEHTTTSRWRITFDIKDHVRQNHPFPTVSVEINMKNHRKHQIKLLVAPNDCWIFEENSRIYGLPTLGGELLPPYPGPPPTSPLPPVPDQDWSDISSMSDSSCGPECFSMSISSPTAEQFPSEEAKSDNDETKSHDSSKRKHGGEYEARQVQQPLRRSARLMGEAPRD